MQCQVIASITGLNPDTVARYADAAGIDQLLASKLRHSALDPFKTYLDTRWNVGCTNTVRLTLELRERGYHGSDRTVRRYLEPLRAAGSPAAHAPTPPRHRVAHPPPRRRPTQAPAPTQSHPSPLPTTSSAVH
jgi:hypothetical protein